MKSKFKSAFILPFSCGFLLLTLAACSDSDINLPNVFGGNEVPDDILVQPRLVQQPPAGYTDTMEWQRLGDVPPMPKTFSPKPVVDQAINEMQYDRDRAEELNKAYEEDSQITPAADVQGY